MSLILLQHCVPFIVAGGPPPRSGSITLSGGAAGDGAVEIKTDPTGSIPPYPTGAPPVTVPLEGVVSVILHYHKAEGGPDSIVVEFELELL